MPLLPRAPLSARLLQHPLTDGHDEAGLLGDVEEILRPQHAAVRMLPAHERLHGDDLPGLRGHLRLVAYRELATPERPPQRALELHAVGKSGTHARVEDLVALLALPLGLIQ